MASITTAACTVDNTCPVTDVGFLSVPPSLEGSAVMLAGFAVLVPINIGTGLRFKTPMFATLMVIGCLLEVIGYTGRILLRPELANRGYFVLYLLGTIMGPTFLSAAIFVILPHMFALYGMVGSKTILQPLWITILFLGFNVFTLAFQGVGCAFAVDGTSKPEMSQGNNILLAGLGLQLASLVAFYLIFYWLLLKSSRHEQLIHTRHSHIYQSSHFKLFLIGLQIASGFIFVRTVTRIIQFVGGLGSALAQSEVLFLVLDGTTVLFAGSIMSIVPPGLAFGQAWSRTSPHSKRRATDPALLHHRQSPYAYNFTHVPKLTANQLNQQPGHWQQPGFQRPNLANFVPPYKKTPVVPQETHPVVSLPESPPAATYSHQRSSSGYDLPPWEVAPRQVPFLPPDEANRPQGFRPGGAQKDVVDPDALWG